MRGLAPVVAACLTLVPVVLLTGCETPSTTATAQPSAAATTVTTAKPRCEKREVTGSRLARCDEGDVRVISGEEVRSSGMPGTGAGGGAAPRQ